MTIVRKHKRKGGIIVRSHKRKKKSGRKYLTPLPRGISRDAFQALLSRRKVFGEVKDNTLIVDAEDKLALTPSEYVKAGKRFRRGY